MPIGHITTAAPYPLPQEEEAINLGAYNWTEPPDTVMQEGPDELCRECLQVIRPPVEYNGDDTQCSICIQEFRPGERVVRLVCGHTFHGTCLTTFHNSVRERTGETAYRCPNCRGPPQVIAIWNYLDHNIVTQTLADGTVADNLLNPEEPAETQFVIPAVQQALETPRSMETDFEFHSPQPHSQKPWLSS